MQDENKEELKEVFYNKRTWLCNDKFSSTSSVVAYFGPSNYKNHDAYEMFIEISDCNNSITLHKSNKETIQDYKNKIKLLSNEIQEYLEFLEKEVITE